MNQDSQSPDKLLARAVGAAIAGRRKARGLTQAQLAEQMGIEKETMSRLETGNISPTLGRLAQLARLLECDIGEFLQTTTPELTSQALALLGRMDDLSMSQQETLIRLFGRIVLAMGKLNAKERKAVEQFLSSLL